MSLNGKIAAMLAEGSDFSKPAPVIYVSGEEVSFAFVAYGSIDTLLVFPMLHWHHSHS